MSVGPDGFALGEAPKLEERETETGKQPEQIIEDVQKREPTKDPSLELSKYFRLVHSAFPNPERSQKPETPYYTIRVWLESDSPALIEIVSKVIYHLHPTFPDPDREITTRNNNFEQMTWGWGQFNLSADIYFMDDEEKPLKLFRYLNF